MKRRAWGKYDEERGVFHPLAHHSIDVAAVFLRMIGLPVVRNRLETAAKRRLADVECHRLAVLAFLHDIGKLHPGFQAKGWPEDLRRGPPYGHLKEGCAFLTLACRGPEHPFHETMREIMGWGESIGPLVAASIAHHGRPVEWPADPTLGGWQDLDHYDWRAETRVMDDALRRWFAPAFEAADEPLPDEPLLHHVFAGLVALADWIGSDIRFFPFVDPFDPAYDATAHDRALKSLEAVGFDPGALPTGPAVDFHRMTGFYKPNPAQAATAAVDTGARLLILESETGSGKTEAALWRFTRLFEAGKVSGLYFAVPTRAAARQLHDRVVRALRRAFGAEAPEAVLAVPGMLRAGEFKGQRLPHWRVRWDDDGEPTPQRWAAEHATRFLAATVAVGTVDQAMLAGLQVKHAHLRGSALARSLLVIDEVHASDAYMTEIMAELLKGHLAVGGYAMLMSATLGARARVRWTDEAMPDFETARAAPYPALWAGGENAPRAAADAGAPKIVHPEAVSTMDPAEAARRAISAARRGARVLVIRNTVRMAVATWRAVSEAGGESLLMRAAGEPALHHSRFAVEDRLLLDEAVEEAFAPHRTRDRQGCIAVGTQTLEQSLDIDADLLIADLCPMDVLLQRIGRLHRHDLPRPDGFETARAAVLLPEGGLDRLTKPAFCNGLGAWEAEGGGFNGIYLDLAGLELTRRLIVNRPIWRIPEMNRELVEGATHRDPVNALLDQKGEEWGRYDRKVGGVEAAGAMMGRLNVLDRKRPFHELQFPDSDRRIMTRLGEEGVVLALDHDQAPIGPFKRPVSRIALPARWSPGVAHDAEVKVSSTASGLVLAVGERHFEYSREGLVRPRA